jgi:hypothetical protein
MRRQMASHSLIGPHQSAFLYAPQNNKMQLTRSGHSRWAALAADLGVIPAPKAAMKRPPTVVSTIACLSLCGVVGFLLARREGARVRVAVWQYQLASHSGLRDSPVCIGVRGSAADTRVIADPSADTLATLRSPGAHVVPWSKCLGSGVELILGRVAYRSPSEATVEGSAPLGGYRYHVMRVRGAWRVRGADMTWIH